MVCDRVAMLGKRKRDVQVVSSSKDEAFNYHSRSSTNLDASDIFRKHFEATFAPLPEKSSDEAESSDEEDPDASEAESEVSAWSGLSKSSDHIPVVEVVDYTSTDTGADDEFHRARQKAFMVRPSRFLKQQEH